jgi:hypothetical protein
MVINENFQDLTLIDDLFNSSFDLSNHKIEAQTIESIMSYLDNEVFELDYFLIIYFVSLKDFVFIQLSIDYSLQQIMYMYIIPILMKY